MKRQTWFIILRAAFSIGLIGLLLYYARLPDLAAILTKISWWWLLAAIALQFVSVFICTWRWQILLSAQNMRYSFLLLTSLNFVGRFFNIFLPTAQGGDIVRMYELTLHSQRSTDSITSVLAEKLLGFLALFVICWVAMVAGGWRLLTGTNSLPIIVALSLAFILAIVVLLNRRLMLWLISLTRSIRFIKLENWLTRIYNSLQELAKFKNALMQVFWISLLNQFVAILCVYFTALALDILLPFDFFLIIIPVISVIVMVPVSIGGLGVREGAYVFFFGQQGVVEAASISLSLLFFSQTLVVALVGGVIYLLGRYRKKNIQDDQP